VIAIKRNVTISEWMLTLGAVLLAGTAPNLFVVAQAGYVKFSVLGKYGMIPAVVLLIGLFFFSRSRFPLFAGGLARGALAGLIATLGLEVIREIGYHLGWMPGDMPKLMGVLLLDRFLEGPSFLSNLAGWGYHFLNGASFGIILALLLGGGRWWAGPIYGFLIGIGFMMSPAVTALGVGRFGLLFGPGFAVTVTLAHLAYGLILGLLLARRLEGGGIVARLFAPAPAAR